MSASNGGRSKRKREGRRRDVDDKLQREYGGISFSSRESSGRPGTPHRYFESSYDVLPVVVESSRSAYQGGMAKPSELKKPGSLQQIVHRHANGLCIVTAGEIVKKACEVPPSDAKEATPPIHVVKVEYAVKEAEGQSVGSKRRKKMAKASNSKGSKKSGSDQGSSGIARPSDKLARIELSNGSSIDLVCCVFGTILEINKNLIDVPSLLVDDPLLDGYMAVIMPQGPFPFPPVLSDNAAHT